MTKTNAGNFFEDFRLGQIIRHATPRTMTGGRRGALSRRCSARALPCSRRTRSPPPSAIAQAPLDDLLVFHVVFGKTVPDISLNAVANLGYAGLPVPGPGVSRRYAERDVRGDRAEGELQPQDRHRLCAHARHQAGRRGGAGLRALGDGAKARRERAGAGRPRAASCRPRSSRDCSAAPCPPIDVEGYDFALAGSPHRFERLRGRREDRPCRRHDGRGGRAPDRDAALPEHRAHPFRPVLRRRRAASAGG